MMKKLIILAVLALSACSPTAKDGYTFEQKSKRIDPPVAIRVVVYPSLAALTKTYRENHDATKLPENRELMAYSVIGHGICTIHMIDPKVRYMPEFFGHELTHCLYGEFHPSQNG